MRQLQQLLWQLTLCWRLNTVQQLVERPQHIEQALPWC
jgi:hypothetical protein